MHGQGNSRLLTRRRLLVMGAATSAAAPLTGCDMLSTKPSGERGRQRAAKGNEPPALAKQVKAGDLPKVADRLPHRPVVVRPVGRPGVYGGTWHTALLGAADTSWLGRTIGYETLTRWTRDWSGSIPNIAESVRSSPDAREFTIRLRRRMKWSDGHPFTADDLVFAYDDVLLNAKLTPVTPDYFVSAGKPGRIRKVDDRTVRLTFAKPNGLLMLHLSWGTALEVYPRHYLRRFHQKYNPDVGDLAKKEGVANWAELFLGKVDPWSNPDLPTLHPWRVTTPLGKGSQVVAERNPYYFKTDSEGSQLPYIDKVLFYVIDDIQVILLKATNGELDFHTRHFNTPPNKPVLARSRDKGDYDFDTLSPTYENEMVIAPNLTHEDPVKREIFQNRDFRIGLSHALNRQEMIDTVYQAQAKPWQVAPRRESEFFDEEFATQYLEYDVDKANHHLDKAGYSKKDGEGFRLGPDGKRISFDVEVATPALIPFWTDGMQLAVDYWRKVGIDARVKSESRSLFYARKAANKPDAGVWTGYGGLTNDAILYPGWYLPYSDGSNFAVPWATWFASRGETGEKPPAAPLEQMRLYWQLLETPSEGRRKDLFRKILQISKEQFYVIGTLIAVDYYGIVKNGFHNVPASMPESWIVSTPAISDPEQYFIGG